MRIYLFAFLLLWGFLSLGNTAFAGKKNKHDNSDNYITKTCSACQGDGKCHKCMGAGENIYKKDDGDYYRYDNGDLMYMRCWDCNGTGKCAKCEGKGEVTVINTEYVENKEKARTGLITLLVTLGCLVIVLLASL